MPTQIVEDEDLEISMDSEYTLAAVTEGGLIEFLTPGGSLCYVDVSNYTGPIVAIAFAGVGKSYYVDDLYDYYYYGLAADGAIYLFMFEPYIDEYDGEYCVDMDIIGLWYYGTLENFYVGEDLTAYSMAYGNSITEEESVFIADNTNQAIFYISLEDDNYDEDTDTLGVQLVGRLEGTTNVSTLFENYYDSFGSLTLEANVTVKDASFAKEIEVVAESTVLNLAEGSEEESVVEEEPGDDVVEEPVAEEEVVIDEETPAEEEPVVEEELAEEVVEDSTAEEDGKEETPAEEEADVEEESETEEEPSVEEVPSEEETPAEEEPVVEVIIEEPVEEDDGEAVRAFGTLNYISHSVGTKVQKETESVIEVDDDDTVSVTITESDEINNGLYVVKYDPDNMTYLSSQSDADLSSFHIDEEKGTVTFAFATLDPVTGEEAVATILFDEGCEESEISITTVESGTEFEVNTTEAEVMEGTGHAWGDPTWTWSDDLQTATATFVCGDNSEHVVEIITDVISSTHQPTNSTDEGYNQFVATVEFNGNTYTVVKKVPLGVEGRKIPNTFGLGELPAEIAEVSEPSSNNNVWMYVMALSAVAAGSVLIFLKKRKARASE